MPKDRSFAAKVAKGTIGAHGKKCPKCGEIFSMVKVVSTEKSNNETYKFKEGMVSVCKCNEKEVYA